MTEHRTTLLRPWQTPQTRHQSLADLYAVATSNSGSDRDDITMVLIVRREGSSCFDNDIVEIPESAEETLREKPILTSGTTDDDAFIQISGKATWIRSTIFFDTANVLLKVNQLTIDLNDCELLDSTFLGTIHEVVVSHPGRVYLQRVPDEILGLFEELSMRAVTERITADFAPLPARMAPLGARNQRRGAA